MTTLPTETPVPEFVVQPAVRFSESLIWQLQRQYYVTQGIEAWSGNRVPFSISTSPMIAHAYMQTILGFLQDWQSQLDLSEPVYIVEIGAGSGRLGFNVLRQLEDFLPQSALAHIPLQYVLTDFAEKNVAFWQQHDGLKRFVERGWLDFAQFDAIKDTELHLRHSNKVLKAGSLKNPVIVLANYLFDSLPMDLFSIEQGQIYEVHAEIVSTMPAEDLNDPKIIETIEILYDRFPIDPATYYEDPEVAHILTYYRDHLTTTIVSMPYLALQCVRSMQRLAGNRLLLLSADKGNHQEHELNDEDVPSISLHDNGFSMMFNYNAFVHYFQQQGASVLTTEHRFTSLNIIAFVQNAPSLVFTQHAYHSFIQNYNPDDNFTAFLDFNKKEKLALVELLAYMRFKLYDPHAFLLIYPVLRMKFNGIPSAILNDLRLLAERVWQNYYHIGEKANVPFYLGALLSAIRCYKEALVYFEAAQHWYGDNGANWFNMGMCYYNLKDKDNALRCLAQAEAASPDMKTGIDEVRVKVHAEL